MLDELGAKSVEVLELSSAFKMLVGSFTLRGSCSNFLVLTNSFSGCLAKKSKARSLAFLEPLGQVVFGEA
jgi:hypothetical protein